MDLAVTQRTAFLRFSITKLPNYQIFHNSHHITSRLNQKKSSKEKIMDPYSQNYLEKMLPGFEKKPKEPTFIPPAPAVKSSKPPEVKTPGVDMLASIVSFLRKHLVCDDQQLTVLALWVAQTWCFDAFPSTAYLDVRSPESQSGKSLLLDLLELLCAEPKRINGGSPKTLFGKLGTPPTIRPSPLAAVRKKKRFHHPLSSSTIVSTPSALPSASRCSPRLTRARAEGASTPSATTNFPSSIPKPLPPASLYRDLWRRVASRFSFAVRSHRM